MGYVEERKKSWHLKTWLLADELPWILLLEELQGEDSGDGHIHAVKALPGFSGTGVEALNHGCAPLWISFFFLK